MGNVKRVAKKIQGSLPIVGLLSRLSAPGGGFDEIVSVVLQCVGVCGSWTRGAARPWLRSQDGSAPCHIRQLLGGAANLMPCANGMYLWA